MRYRVALIVSACLLAACGSDSEEAASPWSLNDKLANRPEPMPTPDPKPEPKPEPEPEPDPVLEPEWRQVSAWVGRERIGNCIEDVQFMRFGEQGKFQAMTLENNHCFEPELRGLYVCDGTYKIMGESFSMDCASGPDKGFNMSAAGTSWAGELNGMPYLGLGVFWGDGADWRATFSRELRGLPNQDAPSFTESFEISLNNLAPPMLMGGEHPDVRVKGRVKVGDVNLSQGGSFDFPLRVYTWATRTEGHVVSFVAPDAQYPAEEWQQLLERGSGLRRDDAVAMARLLPFRYSAVSLQMDGVAKWVLVPLADTGSLYPRVWRGSEDVCQELGYFVESSPAMRLWCQSL